MDQKFVLFISVLLLTAGALAVSGCTDSQSTAQTPVMTQQTAPPATAQTTPGPTELPWIVWREGSNTLNQLGGYHAYSPNVNGQKFKALKVEVRSNYPVTVLFLNDTELSKFEKKMATNAGEYEPVERYEDVNYKVMEEYSDDYLNVVILNPGKKLVTADFNIWYKNIV